MGTSTFGSFGSSGAPGFVNPFAASAVTGATGTNIEAMANRYNQLGLAHQGATPTSPGGGGPGTPEMMDLGMAPSVTGGIPAEAQATLGELVNSSLSTSPSGTGKQSGTSQIGPLASLAGGLK